MEQNDCQNDIEVRKPDDSRQGDDIPVIDITKIDIDEEVGSYIKEGLTMIRFQGPTGDPIFRPYNVKHVWEQNMKFTFWGANGTYRAMYILIPAVGSAWPLDNDIYGNMNISFIAGVCFKKPGFKVLKMHFATFVE